MSDHAKKKRINSNTLHILDLPEQIFRKIFSYLDDEAIFNLKNICNRITREPLELLTGDTGVIYYQTCGILIIYKLVHYTKCDPTCVCNPTEARPAY